MKPARAQGGPLGHAPAPSVLHLLHDAARSAPGQPAVWFMGQHTSYGEYAGLVAGLAQRLIELGARGQRVAVVMANSLETAVALFAAQAAGAQVVPVNPLYSERELAQILDDARPRVVIADPVLSPAVTRIAHGAQLLPAGQGRALLDAAWATLGAQSLAPLLPDAESFALLQYTGGTTGRPKGVQLRHRQLVVNVEQREARLPTQPGEERVLCVMPLFHVFALSMCLYLAARARSELVILPRWNADAVIDALSAHRITVFPAGPSIFTGLLQSPRFAQADLSALRLCCSGSAALPAEVLRRWREITGTFIYEGYGQTEAGPVLTYAGPGLDQRVGCVGTPLADTCIEIVDLKDRHRVLACGERGEIRARGPQIMDGYLDRPEETAQALVDGWLYTGDIGEIDQDGILAIRDRKKEMAIVGGYNVYPREVDEVLFQIAGVREAAAFGVQDAFYGEVIAAVLVVDDAGPRTADAVVAACKAGLAPYKVPRHVRFADALPRTAAGKIDKVALKAAFDLEARPAP